MGERAGECRQHGSHRRGHGGCGRPTVGVKTLERWREIGWFQNAFPLGKSGGMLAGGASSSVKQVSRTSRTTVIDGASAQRALRRRNRRSYGFCFTCTVP